jgi:hypothetical protein
VDGAIRQPCPLSSMAQIGSTPTAATGRLLGVQLFGHRHAEIAKRIDIAATAIFHGMTVDAVSDWTCPTPPGRPLGSGPDGRPGGHVDVIISNCVINLSADKARVLAKASVSCGTAAAWASATSPPTTASTPASEARPNNASAAPAAP